MDITEGTQHGVLEEDAGSRMLMSAAVLFDYEKELEHEMRTRVKRNHLTHSRFSRRKIFKG